ncbi:protein spitz-like [Cydia fagiglandana]|uniref:protein spitz-like n=1 Tax=Cydia fagiglandana TaxID=1458189 RepID=UPI002FEE1C4C
MRAKGSKFESGHVIASRISYKSPSNVKIVHVPRAPIREPRTLRSVRKMQSLIVWWAVVSAAWALAGACSSSISKRPARPARPVAAAPARPPPQPRLNVTFPTFKCEPDYSEYYCLNGGVCFTVVISDSPIYNCECRSGFVGQRCEFKDLDDSYVLTSRQLMMETASIAGGATVAVFLAILVCFGAWVRLRRRAPAPKAPESGLPARVQLVALAPPGRPAAVAVHPPRPPDQR